MHCNTNRRGIPPLSSYPVDPYAVELMAKLFGEKNSDLKKVPSVQIEEIDDAELDAICLRAAIETPVRPEPEEELASPSSIDALERATTVELSPSPPSPALPAALQQFGVPDEEESQSMTQPVADSNASTVDGSAPPAVGRLTFPVVVEQLDQLYKASLAHLPEAVFVLDSMAGESRIDIPREGRGPPSTSAILRIIDRRIVKRSISDPHRRSVALAITYLDNAKLLIASLYREIKRLDPDNAILRTMHPSLECPTASGPTS